MQQNQELTVCIAGATGWTGQALVRGVLAAPDLSLRSAVSRSAAGSDLGEALGQEPLGVPAYATVQEALDGVDVLIETDTTRACRLPFECDTPERKRQAGPNQHAAMRHLGRLYGAASRAASSRRTSTIRSTSACVVRQLTIAGRKATRPSYRVVPT